MAIEKAALPATGMPEMGESALEIVIENPDSVGIFDEEGGFLLDLDPDASLIGDTHSSNLVEFLAGCRSPNILLNLR